MSKLTVYSASAGSGKTFTLAVEYIKLLFKSRYEYRHILAVTFTNKATADGLYIALQNKVKRMEKEAGSMKKNSEEAKKIKAYLNVMREAGVIE